MLGGGVTRPVTRFGVYARRLGPLLRRAMATVTAAPAMAQQQACCFAHCQDSSPLESDTEGGGGRVDVETNPALLLGDAGPIRWNLADGTASFHPRCWATLEQRVQQLGKRGRTPQPADPAMLRAVAAFFIDLAEKRAVCPHFLCSKALSSVRKKNRRWPGGSRRSRSCPCSLKPRRRPSTTPAPRTWRTPRASSARCSGRRARGPWCSWGRGSLPRRAWATTGGSPGSGPRRHR